MSRLHAAQAMSLRKLTRQVMVKLRESGSQRVLVTSVRPGDGKSLFVKNLARGLSKCGYEKKTDIIPASKLHSREPQDTDRLVLVDGPAFFDSDGFEKIPEAWMERFDAAAVVLLSRSSRRVEVVELFDWLRQYRIHEIWPIWNEKLKPPPVSLRERLRVALGTTKVKPVRTEKRPVSQRKDDKEGPRPDLGSDRREAPAPVTLGASATHYAAVGLEHSPHTQARYEPAFVSEETGAAHSEAPRSPPPSTRARGGRDPEEN